MLPVLDTLPAPRATPVLPACAVALATGRGSHLSPAARGAVFALPAMPVILFALAPAALAVPLPTTSPTATPAVPAQAAVSVLAPAALGAAALPTMDLVQTAAVWLPLDDLSSILWAGLAPAPVYSPSEGLAPVLTSAFSPLALEELVCVSALTSLLTFALASVLLPPGVQVSPLLWKNTISGCRELI